MMLLFGCLAQIPSKMLKSFHLKPTQRWLVFAVPALHICLSYMTEMGGIESTISSDTLYCFVDSSDSNCSMHSFEHVFILRALRVPVAAALSKAVSKETVIEAA